MATIRGILSVLLTRTSAHERHHREAEVLLEDLVGAALRKSGFPFVSLYIAIFFSCAYCTWQWTCPASRSLGYCLTHIIRVALQCCVRALPFGRSQAASGARWQPGPHDATQRGRRLDKVWDATWRSQEVLRLFPSGIEYSSSRAAPTHPLSSSFCGHAKVSISGVR